ncbi:MAG: fluoride efflux transporter FluC [Candidatus Cryptobacteroides sp.]
MIRNFIAVGLGGATGAILRYGLTLLAAAAGISGNIATFVVNVLGSFVMGCLAGICREGTWILFLTVGLCGGFTTYSSFSMQSVGLLQQGKWGIAALYVSGTLIACLLVSWLGFMLGHKLCLDN